MVSTAPSPRRDDIASGRSAPHRCWAGRYQGLMDAGSTGVYPEPRWRQCMAVALEHPVAEIRRLQRSIRDLVDLVALPATWAGAEPSVIARSLLDTLPR